MRIRRQNTVNPKAIGVFFIIFSLFFIGLGGFLLQEGLDSNDWLAAGGTITESYVRNNRNSDGTTYCPEVEYTFVVDGTTYYGDSIGVGVDNTCYGTYSMAADKIVEYPIGADVTVYYDEEDISNNALVTGPSFVHYILLGIGLLFFIMGLLAIKFGKKSSGLIDTDQEYYTGTKYGFDPNQHPGQPQSKDEVPEYSSQAHKPVQETPEWMNKMTCFKCGQSNDKDTDYCVNCGSQMEK